MTEDINQIIAPIKEYFKLDSFNFHKIYNDDTQIRLTNKPDWMRYYLSNRLYLDSIFELPAANYERNRFIWSNIDTHNGILKAASNFGIRFGVTFIEPTNDGCEFYFLGTTTNDKNVINNYLSNFKLLEKFVENFHESGKSLFEKIEPHRFIIEDWYQNKTKFNSSGYIDKYKFLANIYGYTFTKREFECIPLLLKVLVQNK